MPVCPGALTRRFGTNREWRWQIPNRVGTFRSSGLQPISQVARQDKLRGRYWVPTGKTASKIKDESSSRDKGQRVSEDEGMRARASETDDAEALSAAFDSG